VRYFQDAAPRRSNAIGRTLKACALFDSHEPVLALTPIKPVVLLGSGDKRVLGTATFRAAVFAASSKRHEIRFKMSLQSMIVPGEVHPACRIVPATWAVIELRCPERVLERLPTRWREKREAGVLRQVLDESEIDGGALDELCSALTMALEASQAGPYR